MPIEVREPDEENEELSPGEMFLKQLSTPDVLSDEDFRFTKVAKSRNLATSQMPPEEAKYIIGSIKEYSLLSEFPRYQKYAKHNSDMLVPRIMINKSVTRVNRETLLDKMFRSRQEVKQTVSPEPTAQPIKSGNAFSKLFRMG